MEPRLAVYFATFTGEDIIKIGCSSQPGNRRHMLLIDFRKRFGRNATDVEYLAVIHGSFELEAYYHSLFEAERISAVEWYRSSERLLSVVAGLQPRCVDVSFFYKRRDECLITTDNPSYR